jgi:hypothetical protein
MDAIAPTVCKVFGMVLYWNTKHVNQAIIRWVSNKHSYCLSFVFHNMQLLHDCLEQEKANKIVDQLKTLLNLESKEGVSNFYYYPPM